MQDNGKKKEAAKMKKSFAIVLGFILCLCLSVCFGQETQQQTSSQLNSSQEQSDTRVDDAGSSDKVLTDTAESDAAVSLEAEEESMGRKLKLTVEGQKLSITLYDTPAANALYDILPLELTFEDFNGVEKISYPTDELPIEGELDGCDPDVGDFCLYAPWENLSIFYQDFRYSDSLIKLGHIDTGMEIISSMNEDFSAILEKAE